MNIEDKVVENLSDIPISFISLAKRINWPRKNNYQLSILLDKLVKSSKIIKDKNGFYFVPKILRKIEGNIKVHSKGFAFIDLEETQESIFIPAPNVNSAMNDDKVLVHVFKDQKRENALQGIVAKVLQRNKTTFVGTTKKFGPNWGLIPLDKKISGHFRFEKENNLQENLEVLVEIIKFGDKPIVRIKKILGSSNDVSVDILSWITEFNISQKFEDNLLDQTKEIPQKVSQEEIGDRKDFRENLIVTIDGDDTKDFDDAIEVIKLENGNFILKVHIADVTYYVKENSLIDLEAKKRGTSIYLADRVIPMLPKELSNGICSLNPHVDRMTITCEVEIDKNGQNRNCKIYESVINSKHRLTYKEVNNFYEKKSYFEDKKLEKMLNQAYELTKIIRNNKNKEGYIDFEIEESKIIIDEKGKTQDIVIRERSYSEMMIEDFMVKANEVVAKYISEMKLPFIFRIHETPSEDKLKRLQNVINLIGVKQNVPLKISPPKFRDLIMEVKKNRFDDFIKMTLLQTMEKAIYSSDNIGHFGLASEFYTHFTSPIRRYPDLMVHRMLREYLFKDNLEQGSHFAKILPAITSHSSTTERKAVELERKVADIKKAEFFEKSIGKSFEGTIVSVNKFGFFVDFSSKVSGLVRAENIIDDNYKLSEDKLSLKGKTQKFTIGNKINVTIVSVEKNEGKINLVLQSQYDKWKTLNKR